MIDCVTNDAFRLLFANLDGIFSTVVNKTMFIDFLIEMFPFRQEAAVKAWIEPRWRKQTHRNRRVHQRQKLPKVGTTLKGEPWILSRRSWAVARHKCNLKLTC